MGQLLQADNPSGLRYAAINFGEPGHYLPWLHLHKAVKEGEAGEGDSLRQGIGAWGGGVCVCVGGVLLVSLPEPSGCAMPLSTLASRGRPD
jgi:hypothetical protein